MYDLTSEVAPITAKRYGAATRIHLDTQSQDGDSVNSLVHEDVCPTTETEHELRARQMEVEPVETVGSPRIITQLCWSKTGLKST